MTLKLEIGRARRVILPRVEGRTIVNVIHRLPLLLPTSLSQNNFQELSANASRHQ